MKKLNNKGITTVEVIICFVIVVIITVSMYSTISSYNEKRKQERYKEEINNYKEVLTKEIQDDFIKIGLMSANYTKEIDTADKTSTYTVDCNLKDGTQRKLVIIQRFTKSTYHPGGNPNVDDYFMIKYGPPTDMIDYSIPDLGSFKDKDTGKTVKDLSINNIIIKITNDRVLSIYIGFYHPELLTRYAINIVSPINYTFNKASSQANGGIDNNDAVFLPGREANIKMKKLAGDNTDEKNEKTVNSNVIAILKSDTEPTQDHKESKNILSIIGSGTPIYMWYDSNILYWWSRDERPSLNEDSAFMFNNFSSLIDIRGIADLDTSMARSFENIFAANKSMTDYSNLRNWKTSNVEDLTGAFGANNSLPNLNGLQDWNVSNVNSLYSTFARNFALNDISALAAWDVSNVTNMSGTFQVDLSLQSLHGLENWNVEKVTSLHGTFMGHSTVGDMIIDNLEPLANWDISNVQDMTGIFSKCTHLTNLHGLENWKPFKAANMQSSFYSCSSLTDLSAIANWNTSGVTNMKALFEYCTSLESLDSIRNWNIDNVNSFESTFARCTSLNDVSGIANWNIKKTMNFTKMFYQSPTHPEFSKLSGIWNSSGTFIPNS